jgi:hypothetical protein
MMEEQSMEEMLFNDSEDVKVPSVSEEEAFLKDLGITDAPEVSPQERYSKELDDSRVSKEPVYEVFKTEGGKEMTIYRQDNGRFKIKFLSGGELPGWLDGQYTDERNAYLDINKYLAE